TRRSSELSFGQLQCSYFTVVSTAPAHYSVRTEVPTQWATAVGTKSRITRRWSLFFRDRGRISNIFRTKQYKDTCLSDTTFAEVSQEALLKIFPIPEAPDSTLGKIEKHLSENLMGFLGEHIVAREKPLHEIEQNFNVSEIPEEPRYVSDHTEFLLNNLVAHSVHTSSPRFIGHMT